MTQLTRQDLMSLEEYSIKRPEFRQQVMAHKKNRVIPVGPAMMMYFEDRLTMQYQIQEMLRVEKIFDAAGIQEELDAYNPLIPDGSNWKATQMIEFPDPAVRAAELAKLIGIEKATYVQVEGHDRVHAIADEDLERDNDEKTSSVHFMRFELTGPMKADVLDGAAITVGVDHPRYQHVTRLNDAQRESLANDLS